MSQALPPGASDDSDLEADNAEFWTALLGYADADLSDVKELRALDIGCHRGGLLDRIARTRSVRTLAGIEPDERARSFAVARLRERCADLRVVHPDNWADLPSTTYDLVTCHEVLYLVADIAALFAQVRRVLAQDGVAYFVLGCHPDNPVWPRWRALLQSAQVETYEHRPFDVVVAASVAGLSCTMRPLRRDGWIRYDPTRAVFTFATSQELFDHHFRHKLVFRCARK